MIIEVAGDILLSKAKVIVHGVAANDPMKQGLAKSLHEKMPAMHKDFHHWCHLEHPEPGAAWIWTAADGARIVNLITQEGGYGHGAQPGKASITHVNHALKALKKMARKEKFPAMALPRLATGVGGLNWEDVYPLIRDHLEDLDIPVYVYVEYIPNKTATER